MNATDLDKTFVGCLGNQVLQHPGLLLNHREDNLYSIHASIFPQVGGWANTD